MADSAETSRSQSESGGDLLGEARRRFSAILNESESIPGAVPTAAFICAAVARAAVSGTAANVSTSAVCLAIEPAAASYPADPAYARLSPRPAAHTDAIALGRLL